MKSIFIIILFSFVLGGCTKTTTPKSSVDSYHFQEDEHGWVNVMQESLRIQRDSSLSKEEKRALLEKLQTVNNQQLNNELEEAKSRY